MAGRPLNAEIIAQGYGFAYTKYPFTLMDEFRRLWSWRRHRELHALITVV